VTSSRAKILLTGAMGQVGWELSRTLPAIGEVVALDRSGLDLTRTDELRRVLRETRPDVVVNAAAYTAVDKAESEPELARLVNAVAPRVLAEELQSTGGVLVHYSTDYVFDGTQQTPYTEDDEPAPLSTYGASKLEGERAIQAVGGAHLILRTSWVYGSRGKNFLLTMLNLFKEREEVKIVDDQIGAPTWCRWLAESTAQVLSQCIEGGKPSAHLTGARNGIYHMSAGGKTSWFGFASAIRDLRPAKPGLRRPELIPIPSAAYPLPAKRPANSVLSNEKLRAAFGVLQPPWDSLLRRCMAEITLG
jgi:dTDP-4-dehydrorhamnose reductase